MTQQLDLLMNTSNPMTTDLGNSQQFHNENNSENGQFGNILDNANKNYKSETNDYAPNKQYDFKETSYKSTNNDLKNESDNNIKNEDQEKSATKTPIKEELLKEELLSAEENAELSDESLALELALRNMNGSEDIKLNEEYTKSNTGLPTLLKEEISMQLPEGAEGLEEMPTDAIAGGLYKSQTAITDNASAVQNIQNVTGADVKSVEAALTDLDKSADSYISSLYKADTKNIAEGLKETIADAKAMDIQAKSELPANNTINLIKGKDIELSKNGDDIKDIKIISDDNSKEGIISNKLNLAENQTNDKISKLDENNIKIQVKEVTEKGLDVVDKNIEKIPLNIENKELKQANNISDVKTEQALAQEKATLSAQNQVEAKSADTALNNEAEKLTAKTAVKSDVDVTVKQSASTEEKNVENLPSEKLKVELPNEIKDEKDIKEEIKLSEMDEPQLQMADDVEINIQQNSEVTSDKATKAKDALSKAGLNAEMLSKLDAKVTSMDMASSNNSADLMNQTAQEQLMKATIEQTLNSSKQTETFANTLSKAAQPTQDVQQPQDLSKTDILSQIHAKMNARAANGMQKMTIGLTPESLGKLTIEITNGKNGVSAQFLAENSQAKEMLEKNIEGLKTVLQSQGVNVNNVNVRVGEVQKSEDNSFFQNDSQNFSGEQQNSKDSNGTNKEKHSEFEFINQALMNEANEDRDELSERIQMTEKTVNIGNVSYKI